MAQQRFQKRFELEVPARGAFGPSPSREEIFSFVLPDTFAVNRTVGSHGVSITNVNFGGLTERRREVREVPNGIELVWKLSNGEVFPVNGRKGFIEIELTGNPLQQVQLTDRYRSIRQRFFSNFYFSGHVAESVDPSVPGGKVKFADQTIYLGFALMVMATEVGVLNALGTDSSDARNVIGQLLDTIDALDENAEAYCGAATELNGFFLRDNISGPTDPRLQGRFTECESDFQDAFKENATPSGDQIFGLMFGLFAVVHIANDSTLATKARVICKRLYDYARRSRFVLALPNGNATRRGSDMRWLSSLMHGLQFGITEEDLFDESEISVLGTNAPLTAIASFWDDPVTARQVADLAGREFHLPFVESKIELNSFALHILLMAIAHGDVWSQSEIEAVAMKDQHHLAVLLYCLLHPGKLPMSFDREEITAILNSCPESGPADSLPVTSGWYKDNRWIRSGNLGDASGGGTEMYNGLDWLLLYNLDQLVFIGS